MTTPAEYRALAARVMAGENTDDLNEYIFNATAPHGDGIKHRLWQDMNGKMRVPYGMFFRDLNAADALMAPLRERGWKDMELRHLSGDLWGALIFVPDALFFHHTITGATAKEDHVTSQATGIARTITALALLCQAVELEHADADQR